MINLLIQYHHQCDKSLINSIYHHQCDKSIINSIYYRVYISKAKENESTNIVNIVMTETLQKQFLISIDLKTIKAYNKNHYKFNQITTLSLTNLEIKNYGRKP